MMASTHTGPEATDGRQVSLEKTPRADGTPSLGVGAMRSVAVICTVLALSASFLAGEERVAPKTLKSSDSCLSKDCHAKLDDAASIHRPVEKKECDACHDQEDEEIHEFTFVDEGSELCYGCHKSVTEKRAFTHEPVEDKKRPCLRCHDPHSTATKGLVKAISTADQCLECHTEMAEGARYHKAGTVDSRTIEGCTSCHDPHASDVAMFLRAAPQNLCIDCHTEIKESLTEAKYTHGPLAAGCIACHEPHKPLAGKGLRKRGPGLCVTCHEHFEPAVAAMSKKHSKLLDGNNCGRCHNPHVSSRQFLLTDAPRKLCLGCHATDIATKSGRTMPSVEPQLAKEMHLHGPLVDEECGKCHQPHGNDRFSFLRKSYPETFYSPYTLETYALCFGCHKPSLVADSRTPIATGFRNGNVNLHYLHVNRPQKGRTCRACHANHGTRRPHMLTESVPFGTWKISFAYTDSPTGGTCTTGCHRKKSYDREQPVKLFWVDQGPTTQPAGAARRRPPTDHDPDGRQDPSVTPAPVRAKVVTLSAAMVTPRTPE